MLVRYKIMAFRDKMKSKMKSRVSLWFKIRYGIFTYESYIYEQIRLDFYYDWVHPDKLLFYDI